MIIEKINIYGYGKLHQKEFALSPTIQVFYGQNEAGKSTVMSFIRHLLFGFPTKTQSELRYEPKQSIAYGGSLVLQTKEYGKVTLERVGKSATGDVTLHFEDGRIGGEEELGLLLKGINKITYQDIFSFDVHGLQQVHRINEEELGKYLFSSSMVGSQALVQVEKKLEKEMELLYKPNGKRPIINTELVEAKQLQENYEKWQEKLTQYNHLLTRKRSLKEQLVELEQQKENVQGKIKDTEMKLSLQPLLIEKEQYTTFMKNLGEVTPFPIDGEKRYDTLSSQLQPLQAQFHAFTERKKNLYEQQSQIEVDESLLGQEELILFCQKKREHVEQLEREQEALRLLIEEKEVQLERMQQHIGITLTSEMDISYAVKEKAKEYAASFETLQVRKLHLDENFSSYRDDLENCENNVLHLKKQLLGEEERNALQSSVRSKNSGMSSPAYVQKLKEKRERVKKKAYRKKKQMTVIIIPSLFIDVLLFLYGVFSEQMVLSLVCLFIFFVLWSLFSLSKKGQHEELRDIDQEIAGIQLQEVTYEDELTLQKDEQLRGLLQVEEAKYQQAERNYDNLIRKYEEWEQHIFVIEDEVKGFCSRIGLPQPFPAKQLPAILEQMDEFQESIREIGSGKKRREKNEEELASFYQRLHELVAESRSEPFHAIPLLVAQLAEEKESLQRHRQIGSKIEECEEQIQSISLSMDHLKVELDSLLQKANVADEESYRAKGKAKGQYDEMAKQMSFLTTQISSLSTTVDVSLQANYVDELDQCTRELQLLMEKEGKLQKDSLQCNVQLEALEEGTNYRNVVQELEMKKAQIREKAKRWGALSIAKNILVKTKEKYQQERLPKTLLVAREYFTHLTNGEYVNIYAPANGFMFTVERKDGQRFVAEELSQATSEQLYLALRFALAKTYEASEVYPFIIDDSFVHFDLIRTERVLSLLKDIAKERQVLFFTCHEHIVQMMDDEYSIKM